jgi:hypothetical protein
MADYDALDLSEIEQESSRVNSKGQQNSEGNNNYVRMPDGNSFIVLRFLPRKKGEPLFCAAKYHMLRDSNGNKRVYFSPKQLTKTDKGLRWTGDNSIIDKYLRDLWAKSEKVTGKAQDELRNQYRELKGIERYYYNVIVRQEKDIKTGEMVKNVGPKIFSCGKTIHGMIMRAIVGDEAAGEEALGDITNPKTGRDFKLVKKIVGDYPNYDQSKFVEASPLGEPKEVESWLSGLHDLQSIRVLKSEDELKHALKVHLGLVEDGSNEDFDASEFTSSSSAKKPTKQPKEEVDLGLDSAPSSTSVEEEVMADDEFLKEIDDL